MYTLDVTSLIYVLLDDSYDWQRHMGNSRRTLYVYHRANFKSYHYYYYNYYYYSFKRAGGALSGRNRWQKMLQKKIYKTHEWTNEEVKVGSKSFQKIIGAQTKMLPGAGCMYHTLCTVYHKLFTVHHTQCTVYHTESTVHHTLCTVHHTLCTRWTVG